MLSIVKVGIKLNKIRIKLDCEDFNVKAKIVKVLKTLFPQITFQNHKIPDIFIQCYSAGSSEDSSSGSAGSSTGLFGSSTGSSC